MSVSLVWTIIAFANAALWGGLVVVNKRALAYVEPTALNFAARFIGALGLIVVGVPLTLTRTWSLEFGLNAPGFAYILLDAVIFVFATQTYFLALRRGRVTVVSPIAATDPLWTAALATVLVGAMLTLPTVVGVLVATAGVVLIGRFLETDPEPLGDALPPLTSDDAGGAEARGTEGFDVVALSLVTAICWGVGPVLIELAIDANGALTLTMLIAGQALAALALVPVLILRRRPFLLPGLDAAQRRRAVGLVALVGLIECVYEAVLFAVVDTIGSVLMVLILATSPIWSIAFAMLFLKERPGRRLGFAAAITLTGVLIATLDSLLN